MTTLPRCAEFSFRYLRPTAVIACGNAVKLGDGGYSIVLQVNRFLAHYTTMCPSNDPVSKPESTIQPATSAALNLHQAIAPLPPANLESTEIGGREGLDPTRYGDWEKGGRCIDF